MEPSRMPALQRWSDGGQAKYATLSTPVDELTISELPT